MAAGMVRTVETVSWLTGWQAVGSKQESEQGKEEYKTMPRMCN